MRRNKVSVTYFVIPAFSWGNWGKRHTTPGTTAYLWVTESRRPVFVSSFHESWPATRVVQSENTMTVAPWRRNSVLITLITIGGCFILITLGWQQGFLSLRAWIFLRRVACIQTPFKTPVSLSKPEQGSSNWVASDATKAELFALSARVPRFK
jgi:hypothetical protein